jgi:hypothetical protein
MFSSYVPNSNPKVSLSPVKQPNSPHKPWNVGDGQSKANLDLLQQTADGRLESLLNPKAIIGYNHK